MSDVVLVGPFWTRDETASYLGLTAAELLERDDLVRLSGRWLEETYPAFQFRDNEVRTEVATIVAEVGDELSGAAIADWLFRPNSMLGAMCPNDWCNAGLNIKPVLTAIHNDLDEAKERTAPGVVRTATAS